MTKTTTEQILNLQKMVEDECSRRCELERKLDIATKALKEISHWSPWKDDRDERAKEALKEMEGVK